MDAGILNSVKKLCNKGIGAMESKTQLVPVSSANFDRVWLFSK